MIGDGPRGASKDAAREGDRERLARVLAVVRAGRRIADRSDPLGREARERLPEVTGLTEASVELALSEHLETAPSDEELRALLGRVGASARCLVVLSANVCTAALRAIAIGCATSPRVLAKPSRRDPVVAELCARALAEDRAFAEANGSIEIVREAAPSAGDELHVYGSDETIAKIRSALPAGVVLRAHGTGFGVAIVSEEADLDEAAKGLARDVAPFDQRGCLSPRVAIVIGDAERASRASRSIARELAAWSERAPRGALSSEERADLRRYIATVSALGTCIEGDGFVVGLDEAPRALLLPPSARAVHVVPAATADLERLLSPWTPKIAAIGVALGPHAIDLDHGPSATIDREVLARGARLLRTARGAPSSYGAPEIGGWSLPDACRARLSILGWMQRPPLDGPVDLR